MIPPGPRLRLRGIVKGVVKKTGEVEVTNQPAKKCYEVRLDGELAGRVEYKLSKDLITFTHTAIDPAFEGRGAASALVKGALDDVRASGDRKVLPLCPFVKGWMQRHPDYLDLHH